MSMTWPQSDVYYSPRLLLCYCSPLCGGARVGHVWRSQLQVFQPGAATAAACGAEHSGSGGLADAAQDA